MTMLTRQSCSGLTMILAGSGFLALALTLQGCGGGGGGVPPNPPGWNLNPIEVKGSHMYDAITGDEFFIKGIGFPNVGRKADVSEWIKVLHRIKNLSSEINAVRIYEPPDCSVANIGSRCFEPFMKEADRLGVYVMVPGSGVDWGYFPGQPEACPLGKGLQGCYEVGGILGFGRNVVENFHFPNTLAIVIANEIEQNIEAIPVLKAYARDLKKHMQMCNSNSDSPTKGQMRQIPLMYAATDKSDYTWPEADYLFCDTKDASIDIFGLNVERWISDDSGRQEYDKINQAVEGRRWPGAFIHSEEGGPHGPPYPQSRTWEQIPHFFANWTSIQGFFAYVYYGHEQYNMFDGPTSEANILPDGNNFMSQMHNVGEEPDIKPVTSTTPVCPSSFTFPPDQHITLDDYTDIEIYETGENGWAKNCPQPLQEKNSDVFSKIEQMLIYF